MTPPNEQTLLAKLRSLPPQRQAEVEDFVEFLATKERTCALDRLLKLAPALEAAGAEPMSEEEIVALVEPLTVPRLVHTDPDDDHVLACALAAR